MIRVKYMCLEPKIKYESMSWDLTDGIDKVAIPKVYFSISAWQAGGHNAYAHVMVF